MYDVNYFIKKFEAIPEKFWVAGTQHGGNGTHCALGHCATGEGIYDGQDTPEGLALNQILSILPKAKPYNTLAGPINNGWHERYQQSTPKQRILAALYDIREETIKAQKPADVEALKKVWLGRTA